MIDTKNIDLIKEVEELKKNDPGKERGEDIKYLVSYVKKEKGNDGYNKVIAELKKTGYTMPDISDVDNMDWIATSLVSIFFLTSVKLFNWQEEDIIKMGEGAVSFKSVLKFYVKYFSSVEKTMVMSSKQWRKHYTFGEAEIIKSTKDREIIFRLKNFKTHPFTCIYLMGVVLKVVKMASGKDSVTAREAKCMFDGDPYHEFVFKW